MHGGGDCFLVLPRPAAGVHQGDKQLFFASPPNMPRAANGDVVLSLLLLLLCRCLSLLLLLLFRRCFYCCFVVVLSCCCYCFAVSVSHHVVFAPKTSKMQEKLRSTFPLSVLLFHMTFFFLSVAFVVLFLLPSCCSSPNDGFNVATRSKKIQVVHFPLAADLFLLFLTFVTAVLVAPFALPVTLLATTSLNSTQGKNFT